MAKPRGRETVSDMVARILEREPPWDELPQPLHPSLERLLHLRRQGKAVTTTDKRAS